MSKKEYYQKNKDKIKAYQKERYNKMKNITGITGATQPQSASFVSLCDNTRSEISEQNIMNYLQSWIFSCANINASSVASQQLHLYATVETNGNNKFLFDTKAVSKLKLAELKQSPISKSLATLKRASDVVEVLDHPLIDLLQNINAFNNSFESFELTSMYLDMIGDCYWWVRKDELGVPFEIWVLQGQYMKIVPAPSKFIKGYVYGNSVDDAIKFSTDEIIHFKTPNPNSMYYGKGAAQAVIEAINRMRSMDASEAARLRNMGRPDFIVNYKGGKLDSAEIRRTEKMWMNAFGGPNKNGKIKVMDEDFDLKTLGFSPKDMEYLQGRMWSLKEIAAAFGVPYSMLDSSDAMRATSEIGERQYNKNAILPRITRIAEKLNETLVKMYDPSGRLFLAYDNPVPADRKLILDENTRYVQAGIISINEARQKINLDPLEGEEYDLPKQTSVTPAKDTSDTNTETEVDEVEDEEDTGVQEE